MRDLVFDERYVNGHHFVFYMSSDVCAHCYTWARRACLTCSVRVCSSCITAHIERK